MRTREASIQRYKRLLYFLLFVGPVLLFYITFSLYPIFNTLGYSLTSWSGITAEQEFIGFENYARMFSSDSFMTSLVVTFKFAFFYIILVNVIGFSLALLFDSNVLGKNLFRSLVFMPNAISMIIVAFIWQFIFSNVYGGLVTRLGLDALDISWFGSGGYALAATIITLLWQSTGLFMVIYIAGLHMINPVYYDVADIDGTGPVRKLIHITLPLIMPAFTVNLFFSTMLAFKMFEIFFQMTGGGPGSATEVLSLDIFNEAFNANNVGYASAKAVVLLLIAIGVTYVQVRFTKKREVEA
jgi:raffinose/stachyose/melibiose transport system permease protein